MEGLDVNMTELLKKDTLIRTELEFKLAAMESKMREMDNNMTDFIRTMKNGTENRRSRSPIKVPVINVNSDKEGHGTERTHRNRSGSKRSFC